MIRESRYSSQKLTKKDKIFIDKAFTNFIISHTRLLTKYPHPKEYAYKNIQLINSKRIKLTNLSLLYIINDFSDNVIKPEELLKFVSDKLNSFQYAKSSNLNASNSQANEPNSRDLREMVLEKFENKGYVQNFQGKQYYKKYIKNHPGRKLSKETLGDNGGKRSIYKVDKRFEQYRKLVKKNASSDYIGNKILNNEFIKKVLKYLLIAQFYVAKLDKSTCFLLMESGPDFSIKQIHQRNEEDMLKTYQFLKNMDDGQIEELTEIGINNLKKNEIESFSFAVLMHGLLK